MKVIRNPEDFQIVYSRACGINVHKSCKASPEDILEAVNGVKMNDFQKIRMIKDHLDYLFRLSLLINRSTISSKRFLAWKQPLNTHAWFLAVVIMSEISIDMSPWPSQYNMVSWAGLAPGDNQPAGKKKSVKISHAGVYLKPAMVEAAHAAVMDKKHPYYAIKFRTIQKRRGKKKAVNRNLSHASYWRSRKSC